MIKILSITTIFLSFSCSFEGQNDEDLSEGRTPDEFWEQKNSETTCQVGNPCDF